MTAVELLAKIRFVYANGTQTEVESMHSLLDLDSLAIRMIQEVRDTAGWNEGDFLKAACDLVASLETRIRGRQEK